MVLPAAALWAGLLVGVLRQFAYQADVWRLLARHGLWDYPRFAISDAAVYRRLEQLPAAQMEQFFQDFTTTLQQAVPAVTAQDLAPFATDILVLDHTILDPVLRKRALLRDLPNGDPTLLPGALGCLFDLRRQLWRSVAFTPDPQAAVHPHGHALTANLPPGTLLLCDLGYFSFAWFDQLTEAGVHFVTRVRERVTYTVAHVFYEGGTTDVQLWDALVYLGVHRADRMSVPLRMIRITQHTRSGTHRYTYLTNVLDPRQLPAWQVAALYQRRWDIEKAFDLVKTTLGMHAFWSTLPNVILLQVYATFLIAQCVLALRNQVALAAQVDPREVSLPLLVRWLPRLAQMGHDPLAEFVTQGRAAGYIRPFRGKIWEVPEVAAADYRFPDQPLPCRTARYGSRDYNARTYARSTAKASKREQAWPYPETRIRNTPKK